MANMVQYFPILCTVYSIIVQLAFLDVVEAVYSTMNSNVTGESQQKIDISRRSQPDEILTILKINVKLMKDIKTTLPDGSVMKYEKEEIVVITWKKQPNYLANGNLPVTRSNGDLIPNVMEEIGEFIPYRDHKENSAVIYYAKSKTLSGVIGTRYVVMNLPFEFDSDGNYVGEDPQKYISNSENTASENSAELSHETNGKFPSYSNEIPDEIFSDLFDFGPGPSQKRQRIERNSDINNLAKPINLTELGHERKIRRPRTRTEYYLEILVLVPSEIADFHEEAFGPNDYVKEIVKENIKYFNAVEMALQKIFPRPVKLFINLARIVINFSPLSDLLSDNGIEFSQAAAKIQSYLLAHHEIYPPDSFDYVFVSTSLPIKQNDKFIAGNTEGGQLDMYGGRHLQNVYRAVPTTIVGYFPYEVAVHEIMKMFGIDVEPCYRTVENGFTCNHPQAGTLDDNKRFVQFFKTNQNRCFLMNEPRSLRRPGPSTFLTPNAQCVCFGYNSYVRKPSGPVREYVLTDECDRQMDCVGITDLVVHKFPPKPFDGTICQAFGVSRKVCWNRKCVEIITEGSQRKIVESTVPAFQSEQLNYLDTPQPSTSNDMAIDLKINIKVMRSVKTTLSSGVEKEYEKEEVISLNWMKQPNNLANEHLPVTWSDGNLIPNVMTDIGEFDLYADHEKCSAVVHFKKSGTLSGFIGTQYVIVDLPFEFFDDKGNHVKGDPQKYIMRNDNTAVNEDSSVVSHRISGELPSILNEISSESSRHSLDFGPGPSRKRPRIERDSGMKNVTEPINSTEFQYKRKRREFVSYDHYLEILVLVPHDDIHNFKEAFGPDKYIQVIVKEIIKDFTAVQMAIKNAYQGPYNIFINLAKVVMFPSLCKPGSDEVEFNDAVLQIRSYLADYRDIYTPDSFDYVFASTSRIIKDGNKIIHGNTVSGGSDQYVERHRHHSNIAIPISIVGNFPYDIATHEILKMFNVDVEQCYRRAGNEFTCGHCLRRHSEAQELIEIFFHDNINRCFLINEPRSLRPPGPRFFLTPLQQCHCFGFDSYAKKKSGPIREYVLAKECDELLKCEGITERTLHKFTLKPFEGTRCGGNDKQKVCWKHKCVKILHKAPKTGN